MIPSIAMLVASIVILFEFPSLMALLFVSPLLLFVAGVGLYIVLDSRNTRIERNGSVLSTFNLFGRKTAEFEIVNGTRFKTIPFFRYELSHEGRRNCLPAHFVLCQSLKFSMYAIASGNYALEDDGKN